MNANFQAWAQANLPAGLSLEDAEEVIKKYNSAVARKMCHLPDWFPQTTPELARRCAEELLVAEWGIEL